MNHVLTFNTITRFEWIKIKWKKKIMQKRSVKVKHALEADTKHTKLVENVFEWTIKRLESTINLFKTGKMKNFVWEIWFSWKFQSRTQRKITSEKCWLKSRRWRRRQTEKQTDKSRNGCICLVFTSHNSLAVFFFSFLSHFYIWRYPLLIITHCFGIKLWVLLRNCRNELTLDNEITSRMNVQRAVCKQSFVLEPRASVWRRSSQKRDTK